MGDEPAFAEERLPLEVRDVHGGTDNEDQAERKERLDIAGSEYPEELHDAYNGYPLAPEKRATEPWKMSEYQQRLMADLGLEPPNTEKLVLTLEGKEEYVSHYKNLQFYLIQSPGWSHTSG